ncbi:MAG: VTT domain-containing protein [Gemmatimonadaceae bacterium]
MQNIPLLERLWKYAALGATSIVFEEANPILGGIAVRHGRLGFLGVVVAVALGTWIASIVLYFIGRWRIDWVRARWPGQRELLTGALALVSLHPWRASLAIRFAYGLRLPLPVACGAARLPLSLYVVASGISCWVWSLAFGYLGYAAGGAALRFLGFAQRVDVRLAFMAILLAITLAVLVRRRRIAERTTNRPKTDDAPFARPGERSVAIPELD